MSHFCIFHPSFVPAVSSEQMVSTDRPAGGPVESGQRKSGRKKPRTLLKIVVGDFKGVCAVGSVSSDSLRELQT